MKIEFRDLGFRYARSAPPVFDGLCMKVDGGITLAKGFSGCGKSTLLRLAAGILKPDRGEVHTSSGHPVGSPAYLRREIGMVFQQLNLLPLASVRRNITLAVEMAGADTREIDGLLELLGLAGFADSRPTKLSGGQQQRAAIARALAKRPRILLLDEPTSGLDDLNTQVIINAIRSTLADGAVCMIATHDKRLDSLADEILDFNTFLPVEAHLKALV